MEMGESIVGAYLKHVQRCDLVLYNERTGGQNELDVVGVRKGSTDTVWFCEVATHLQGLQYGNAAQNEKKISEKIASAQQYAHKVFGADEHVFQLWCPRVGLGKNTEWMASMAESHATRGIRVEFVYNERYTAAVQELLNVAKGTTSDTGEPALRMLQILANLKGDLDW
jgi:hypothetical protein